MFYSLCGHFGKVELEKSRRYVSLVFTNPELCHPRETPGRNKLVESSSTIPSIDGNWQRMQPFVEDWGLWEKPCPFLAKVPLDLQSWSWDLSWEGRKKCEVEDFCFFFRAKSIAQPFQPRFPSRDGQAALLPLSPAQGCLLGQVPRIRNSFKIVLRFIIGLYRCKPCVRQVGPISLMGTEEFLG